MNSNETGSHRELITIQDIFSFIKNKEFQKVNPDDIDSLVSHAIPYYYSHSHALWYWRLVLPEIAKLHGSRDWQTFDHKYFSLDIACGGGDSFYPWLPTLLGLWGVKTWGIDVFPQSEAFKGKYIHIKHDLTTLNSSIIEIPNINRHYHLITFMNTICKSPSPTMRRAMDETSLKTNQILSYSEVFQKIINGVEKLLFPGGIFLCDTRTEDNMVFQKTKKGLERLNIKVLK